MPADSRGLRCLDLAGVYTEETPDGGQLKLMLTDFKYRMPDSLSRNRYTVAG